MDKQKKIMWPLYFLTAMSLTLALLKLWAGYAVGSSSLRSMGLNNTADFFYSIILVLGMWVSLQPADDNHPEGHYRYESLVGVGVGSLIVISGLLALYDAYLTIIGERLIKLTALPLVILSGSIGIKVAFSWYLKRLGETVNSPALVAISRDQLGDILADGSVIFALISSRYLWPVLDPVIAALIGVFILKIGYDALRENIGHLTGESASRRLQQKAHELVANETEFDGPYHLRAHHVGPKVFLSFVLRADGNRTLSKLHAEEEKIRDKLLNLDLIERVYIHLEPKKKQ